MSCAYFEERLTGLLRGDLAAEDRGAVLAHLSTCEACRRRHADLENAWLALDMLDEPCPPVSPGVRRGVVRMIEAVAGSPSDWRSDASGQRPVSWHGNAWKPALGVAAALVAAFVGGWALRASSAEGPARFADRLAELEQAVLVARLESADAVARLAAVESAITDVRAHPDVVAALLRTLAEDRSVNVRLAAVEALTPALNERTVALRVARIANNDRSPLVQLALTERLGALSDEAVRAAVAGEIDPARLVPEARQRFEELLGGST